MKWIDAHCHVGQGALNGQDERQLLERMDRLDIAKAVLVPWDRAIAVHNREGNEFVAKLANRYEDRFHFFCTVNPWYGQQAIDELERSAADGAKGLKLHPVYQGCQLTDPIVWTVIEKAIALNLSIYIPTGTPVASLPMQLKYVADRYPEGVFIQGHFGSTDFWIDALPSVVNSPNIYVDTAYNNAGTIEAVIAQIGAQRVVFSTDAPYLSPECEVEKLLSLNVTEEERRQIAGGNIAAIIEGKGRRA